MRNSRLRAAWPVVFVVLCVSASVPALLPPEQDPNEFTSEVAKKAAAKYADAVGKLDEEYSAKLKKVVDQYAKELDEARKLALAKPDLDEAQRVLKAKAEAQAAVWVKPAQRRNFDVISARWGAMTQWLDVTTPVRAKVQDGQLSLVPDQMDFPDPIDGVRKSLVVMYVKDGKMELAIAGDGQPLQLPPTDGR